MSHYKWGMVFPVTSTQLALHWTWDPVIIKNTTKKKKSALHITGKYFSTNKTSLETKSNGNYIYSQTVKKKTVTE